VSFTNESRKPVNGHNECFHAMNSRGLNSHLLTIRVRDCPCQADSFGTGALSVTGCAKLSFQIPYSVRDEALFCAQKGEIVPRNVEPIT
jgi:hypothetical protein